ncbi:toprim domain-containing protein [Nonomuraea jabiensis]|uniref:toprim domain-containing protein n=1 Tax=Nonomuraea jabiensis TaxID=882448 RepID=UPI003D73C33F
MKAIVPSQSSRKFTEESSLRYAAQLDDEALAYLTGPERLLTEETIAKHRFGVVRSPEPGHEMVRGYISIPYLTPDGECISIRFRKLGDGNGPKYLSIAGDIPRPYGTDALEWGSRNICLTEGEFDRAIAVQCGLPAMGLPGANSWDPIWRRLIVQFDAVFVLHDDDDPGRELVAKIANSGIDTVRPIPMTGGDVTSFFRDHGRDGLRAKLGA